MRCAWIWLERRESAVRGRCLAGTPETPGTPKTIFEEGVGYGAATVRKAGGVAVTIESAAGEASFVPS